MEGAERFRPQHLGRGNLDAERGEAQFERRIGQCSRAAPASFATISRGVPLGTQSPVQVEK
jgi:hypothetical protein